MPPNFFLLQLRSKKTTSYLKLRFSLRATKPEIPIFYTENLLSSLINAASFRREERRARWSLESGSEPRWSETCDILGRFLSLFLPIPKVFKTYGLVGDS
jgi:hypothetical protein